MARKPLSLQDFPVNFSDELSPIINNHSPMADMAVALVLTAILENMLMTALDRFFVILQCGECNACKKGQRCSKNDLVFSINGALDGLSKCADLALRLGIITLSMR